MGYRFDISQKQKSEPRRIRTKISKDQSQEWKSDKIKSAENHSDVEIDRQKARSLKTTLALSTKPTS